MCGCCSCRCFCTIWLPTSWAQPSNKHRERTNDSNIYKHDHLGCTTMTTFYFAFEKCWPLAKHRETEKESRKKIILTEHINNRKNWAWARAIWLFFFCSSPLSPFRFRVSRCRFDPFFFKFILSVYATGSESSVENDLNLSFNLHLLFVLTRSPSLSHSLSFSLWMTTKRLIFLSTAKTHFKKWQIQKEISVHFHLSGLFIRFFS